ncbi:hypothetical protein SD427_03415 [Chryseobacterium sp. JJR-5R]|uniref:hypothetical protein n=1 Tax=Chryseobacterium sp. JJR-5R TaxID=3093923 RepID=UPI002A75A29F|nr:hypothetical protein [Chryseobacterium sp. JJR-5R]WPO83403.1 hypothetical protein SD427_03415 [Chryseobacterium sp. JJR-5R]
MDYNLIREIIDLLKDFEKSCRETNKYPITKKGFIAWVSESYISEEQNIEKDDKLIG